MRRVGIKLFLIVVLCSATRDAFAYGPFPIRDRDFTVKVGQHRFGFADWQPGWNSRSDDSLQPFTLLELGPIGKYHVPFSAATGSFGVLFVGVAGTVILAGLVLRPRKPSE